MFPGTRGYNRRVWRFPSGALLPFPFSLLYLPWGCRVALLCQIPAPTQTSSVLLLGFILRAKLWLLKACWPQWFKHCLLINYPILVPWLPPALHVCVCCQLGTSQMPSWEDHSPLCDMWGWVFLCSVFSTCSHLLSVFQDFLKPLVYCWFL